MKIDISITGELADALADYAAGNTTDVEATPDEIKEQARELILDGLGVAWSWVLTTSGRAGLEDDADLKRIPADTPDLEIDVTED